MLHTMRLGRDRRMNEKSNGSTSHIVFFVRLFRFFVLSDILYVCVRSAFIVCYYFIDVKLDRLIFALWQLTWVIAYFSWGVRKKSVCLHDVYPYWFHLTSKYVFLLSEFHYSFDKKSHCLHQNVHCSKSICLFVFEYRNGSASPRLVSTSTHSAIMLLYWSMR